MLLRTIHQPKVPSNCFCRHEIQRYPKEIQYTLKSKTVVHTDHKAWSQNSRDKSAVINRWMDIITEHNVNIKHIEGKHNFVADLLSRCEYQSINSLDDIVKNVHEDIVGHGSFEATYNRCKNYICDKDLSSVVHKIVRECPHCLKHRHFQNKISNNKIEACRVMEIIAMDIFHWNNNNWLIIVDAYSRWAKLFKMDNLMSKSILNVLSSFFKIHKYPKTIIVDAGSNMNSSEIKGYCMNKAIELYAVSPSRTK
eukprot:TRINITY_DN8373_c0_g1_i2.p1 TRINITY_DN8373_c0_g1~~TRINITY_DN8373_c0_g1_i2.p1  ORF type:complete len:253 (+),score=25.17 TRINITY_DN8373_c0_g1_i2:55-813(+)